MDEDVLVLEVSGGAQGSRLFGHVLEAHYLFADVLQSSRQFLGVEGDVEPAGPFVLLDVLCDLAHRILQHLLIRLIEADECGEALVALEEGDLVIESLDLADDVLPYLLALLPAVDRVLGVLAADLVDELALVGLELLVDEVVQLVLALGQLLADVVGQALDVVGQLHLDSRTGTFLRLNSSSLMMLA